MSLNKFSLLKLKFKELIDKEVKTNDSEEFKLRLKKIESDEKRIEEFLENMKTFIECSADMMTNSRLLADAMMVLYSGSLYDT